ncbi:MAG: sarcosine oxidase subunit gamma [Steroidobacteraceae bacterium]
MSVPSHPGGLSAPVRPSAGEPAAPYQVLAQERVGLEVARLTVRREQTIELCRRVHGRFGIELPQQPRRVSAGALAAAGVAPGAWLLIAEAAGSEFIPSLRAAAERCATVVELSDAYAIVRLSGTRVRESLAKLLPLDLHERRFAVGHLAQTVAAHMSVMVWRLEDTPEGLPVFETWAGLSFAASWHRALRQSAAEFGLLFQPAADS